MVVNPQFCEFTLNFSHECGQQKARRIVAGLGYRALLCPFRYGVGLYRLIEPME